jgi:hypothetical protein
MLDLTPNAADKTVLILAHLMCFDALISYAPEAFDALAGKYTAQLLGADASYRYVNYCKVNRLPLRRALDLAEAPAPGKYPDGQE